LRKLIFGLLLFLLVVLLTMGAAGIGYLTGLSNAQGSAASLAPFWQTWEIIHKDYVDQPVDDVKLIQGAINGMMNSLGDEHSGYMDQASFDSANSSISGYEGIGAELDTSGTLIKIIDAFPGSPAAKAGLKPGDQIVQIDGVDVTKEDPKAIWQKVRGPAGTHVKLSIRREGTDGLLEFDLIRAAIQVPSIESRMEPGNIAYISIYFFGDNTDEQVAKALTELMAQKPKGLILDLRGDPGGLVDSAVNIASEFLPENQVVFLEKRSDGVQTPTYTRAGGLALDIPMVVLVNKGSASASEIVAGAIQDHQRGKLVGQTTFGKGSEQYWIQLVDKQGAVRITIARWYTPDGRLIAQQGLTPDFAVPFSEDEFNAGKDPQLAKALELLAP
jgi:carboxyl-terminal processing protease